MFKKTKSIKLMFIINSLSYIGMNFHHPITPTLFTELNLPSYIFGTSFATMCLFSFLFSIYWGEKINKYGRVKILAISTFMYGIGQLCLLLANNEAFIYLGRALAGTFVGGNTVALISYIIDLSDDNNRGKNISILTASSTISGSIGYLIGGFAGNTNYKISLYIQIIWMILLSIFIIFKVEETYINKDYVAKNTNPFKSFINMKKYMNYTLLLILFMVLFSNLATSSYDNSFNYYIKAILDLTPTSNGLFKFAFGIIGLIINMTINIWILRSNNISKKLAIILLLCGLFPIGALLFSDMIPFIMFNVLFFACNYMYQPILQTISLENKYDNDISVITGIVNSIKYLGMVIGSSFAGFIFDIHYNLPFIISIIGFILASIFCILYYRTNKN